MEGQSRSSPNPIVAGGGDDWTPREFERDAVSPEISGSVLQDGEFHTVTPGFSQSEVCINAALDPFGGSMQDKFRYQKAQEEGWELDEY